MKQATEVAETATTVPAVPNQAPSGHGGGITVFLTDEAAATLEEIAKLHGVSLEEALTRALSSEKLIAKVQADNGKILVEQNNSLKEVTFG